MSKITLAALASGFRAANKLNDNFDEISEAFDNCVSRDGSSPNYMLADFDMNGFRILNSPAPVSPTHLVRLQDIQNYVLGGDTTFSFDAVPNILDYRETFGADPSGDNDSSAALTQFASDCSTNKVYGLLTPGIWMFDSDDALWFGPQSGVWAIPWAFNATNGPVGAIIHRPWNSDLRHETTPNVVMHSGSTLWNVGFYYPDVVGRLLNGDYDLDASAYPTIDGAPEVYAPCIVSDHTHNDDGTARSAGINCGGVTLKNIASLGHYDGIYLGDADPDDETWAANGFSSGVGKGIGGFSIDGFYGWGLNRDLIVERQSNLAIINNFITSNGLYPLASQMGVAATSTWDSDNPYPLIKWAQQNKKVFHIRNKFVGGQFTGIKARGARYLFYAEAGTGAGPDGQGNGKFGTSTISGIHVERIPTLLYVASNAYVHRLNVQAGGHFMDHDDTTNVAPVIDIQTDKDVAGDTHKSTGLFVSMGAQTGWISSFDLNIQESDGPIFKNTADDGHTHWRVQGTLRQWAQNDKTNLSAFHFLDSIGHLHNFNTVFQVSAQGSDTVYDVVDSTKLLLVGNAYFGCDTDNIVVGEPDFTFNSSNVASDVDTVTDEDEAGFDTLDPDE